MSKKIYLFKKCLTLFFQSFLADIKEYGYTAVYGRLEKSYPLVNTEEDRYLQCLPRVLLSLVPLFI